MKKTEFTREELYEMVWTEPASKLAKKFQITDTGLRKKCRKAEIPLPPMGYWQKVKYGHKVMKLKLPVEYKGNNTITLCFRDKDGKYVDLERNPKSILKEEFLKDPKLPIKVLERLINPDPLIVQAQNSLLFKKDNRHNYNGRNEPQPSKLAIDVYKSSIPRALRFMDAFIKLLYARNHKIEDKYSRLNGLIYGVSFEFRISEKNTVTKVQDPYPSQIFSPSGILVFSATPFGKKEWYDGKVLIEEKLVDIMIYIELKCKELSDCWAENACRRQIQLEKEQKRKELLARKQAELNAVADLLNKAIRWQQSKFMRDYLATIVQNAENNLNSNDELSEWISWAKHKIDWYDPLIQVKDDLLNDGDRKTLTDRLIKK